MTDNADAKALLMNAEPEQPEQPEQPEHPPAGLQPNARPDLEWHFLQCFGQPSAAETAPPGVSALFNN